MSSWTSADSKYVQIDVVSDIDHLFFSQVQLKAAAEPILAGELFADIAKDDSSWTIRWWLFGGCAYVTNITEDDVMTIDMEKMS